MAKRKRRKTTTKRRASGRRRGRRSSSTPKRRKGSRKRGSRKRRGGKRRARRAAIGTIIIGKKGKRRISRSRRTRFVLRNPGPIFAGLPAGAMGSTTIVSGVSKKRRKKSKGSSKRRRGRRKSSRPKGGKRRRRSSRRRSRGGRRHRPYMGRVVHITLRRKKRYPKWRKAKLRSRGFITRTGKVRNPKRRRNPPPILDRIKAFFTSPSTYVTAGQLLGGMSLATVGPAVAENLSKGRVLNHGWSGVALSGGSTAVAFGAAYYAESMFTDSSGNKPLVLTGLARNVGYGGIALTLLRALFVGAPQLAEWLKLSEPRSPSIAFGRGRAVAPPKGAAGMGYYGMGNVDPGAVNEALIAGESFARSVSQFEGMGDWMELKGMGNFRVPYQDLRGMGLLPGGMSYPGQYGGGGFGDWVEMQPGSAPAQQSWEPAMETF